MRNISMVAWKKFAMKWDVWLQRQPYAYFHYLAAQYWVYSMLWIRLLNGRRADMNADDKGRLGRLWGANLGLRSGRIIYSHSVLKSDIIYCHPPLPSQQHACAEFKLSHTLASLLWNVSWVGRNRPIGRALYMSTPSTSFTGLHLIIWLSLGKLHFSSSSEHLELLKETLNRTLIGIWSLSDLPIPSLPTFYRHRTADAFSPSVLV